MWRAQQAEERLRRCRKRYDSRRKLNGLREAGMRVLLLAAAAAIMAPGVARAADFTVGSPADQPDASVGDGRCAAEGGGCTLRAAVQEADAAGGASTIAIPARRARPAIPPGPGAGA